LAAFARHGAAVVSSDAIVHRLYEENEEVRAAVRDRWGDELLDADGHVDRAAVARRVFGNAEELKWLEALLHPLVKSEYDRWFEEQLALSDPPAIVVSEIPLLYETGGEKRFDKVVVITAPAGVREDRRGPTADREANLLPEESKIAAADYVFENSGSLDELEGFVAHVVEELTRS
jgi:dephospho-CoA kinase